MATPLLKTYIVEIPPSPQKNINPLTKTWKPRRGILFSIFAEIEVHKIISSRVISRKEARSVVLQRRIEILQFACRGLKVSMSKHKGLNNTVNTQTIQFYCSMLTL